MAASVAGAARGPRGGGACVNFLPTPCFIGNLLRCKFLFLVYVKEIHVFRIAYDTNSFFVFDFFDAIFHAYFTLRVRLYNNCISATALARLA